jgi:hypothetical protein
MRDFKSFYMIGMTYFLTYEEFFAFFAKQIISIISCDIFVWVF